MKKCNTMFKMSVAIIGLVLFSTPNQIFKDKFNVNKVDISENNIAKKYLYMNQDFEGIDVIKNSSVDGKLEKNEEAYVIIKNPKGKYYNNVNLKEEKNDIIISYNEESIDSEYKNELYNSRVDEVMVLRINTNDSIDSINIVKN